MTTDLAAKIDGMKGRTDRAKLREVMPHIDAKVREGIRHEDLVKVLAESGLKVSLAVFRNNLYMYRNKQSKVAKPEQRLSLDLAPGEAEFSTSVSVPIAPSWNSEESAEASFNLDEQRVKNEKYMNLQRPVFNKKRTET